MPGRLKTLPGDVERLLVVGDGLFTLAEAKIAGVTPTRLGRLVQARLLVRVAKGVYSSQMHMEDAEPWPAFALRSRAFTLACGPRAYAAGWSAVAIHQLPTIGPPPDLPHVVMPVSEAFTTNATHGRVRASALPPEHRDVAGGTRVTSIARTVVDVARTSPRAEVLVVADAVLAGATTQADLYAVLEFERRWPGNTNAAWVIDHTDPYAESALETLGRLTFIEYDLPIPVSNPWIDLGPLRYRPDHLLDDRWLIFEGDGAGKYDRRRDAARVVEKQREREWHLREAGFEVGRYGWRLAPTRQAAARRPVSRVRRHPPATPTAVPLVPRSPYVPPSRLIDVYFLASINE